MKKVVFIIFIFSGYMSLAQNDLKPIMEQDSVSVKLERSLMYQKLLLGITPSGDFIEPLFIPKFDISTEIGKKYFLDYSKSLSDLFKGNPENINMNFHPFRFNAMIYSSDSYKIGERFMIGGCSYKTTSVFGNLYPNKGIDNFDAYGSTIYFEFKFSDKFKIGTSFDIEHKPGF